MPKIGARKKPGRARTGTHRVGWRGVCGWQPLSDIRDKTLLSLISLGTLAGCPTAPLGLGQMMSTSKVASARCHQPFPFCQGGVPLPRWPTHTPAKQPRNGQFLQLAWPEGPPRDAAEVAACLSLTQHIRAQAVAEEEEGRAQAAASTGSGEQGTSSGTQPGEPQCHAGSESTAPKTQS